MIPNCATKPKRERRLFVGDQLDEIFDFTSLNYRRPFERVRDAMGILKSERC